MENILIRQCFEEESFVALLHVHSILLILHPARGGDLKLYVPNKKSSLKLPLSLQSPVSTDFNCLRLVLEPEDICLLDTIPQILAPTLLLLLLFRSKSGGGLTERQQQQQYKICLPVDHFVVVQRREDCHDTYTKSTSHQ